MENSEWHRDAVALYARFQAGSVTPDEMRAELPSVWRYARTRIHSPAMPPGKEYLVDAVGADVRLWTSKTRRD